jgi:hypothetical protein
MKLSHLTIFFAVLAAAFLPGTAHAQSCYPFYCDIGGVYVQGQIIGYARITDYVGYGETGLEADASIQDPDGNTVASGSDYEPSLEAEAEVTGWPDSQYPYASFSTYLMFQPPNGSWVPISVVNWSWAGDAVLGTNGVWALESSSSGGTLQGTSTTGYPAWSQVVPQEAQCNPKQ